MKFISAVSAVSFVFLCVAAAPASAQTTVVTQPYFTFNDQTQLEPVLREKRRGAKVESAQLDLCYQNGPDNAWDRVVIELKPQGNELAGSGISQVAKTPVVFSYDRKIKGNELGYTGTLKIGVTAVPFKIENISESTEKEYQESVYTIPLIEQPEDFTKVSPQWIALRVKRGSMAAVLQQLRNENVVLDSQFGLTEDCAALRTGTQLIQFLAQPERAANLLPQLRKWDGVLAAGWGNSVWMFYAVRLAGADWSANGKPDRVKLKAALEKSVARALDAKAISSTWDETSGDLVLKFDRPSGRFRGLGFTEKVEVRILAEFERPGNTGDIVVWVNSASARLVDEAPGTRLKIQPVNEMGAEGIYLDQEILTKAIAQDLKGVSWNAQDEKWSDK